MFSRLLVFLGHASVAFVTILCSVSALLGEGDIVSKSISVAFYITILIVDIVVFIIETLERRLKSIKEDRLEEIYKKVKRVEDLSMILYSFRRIDKAEIIRECRKE